MAALKLRLFIKLESILYYEIFITLMLDTVVKFFWGRIAGKYGYRPD